MTILTHEIITEFLIYNGKTGELFWKKRSPVWFSNIRDCNGWNTKYYGKVAGTKGSKNQYVVIGIFGKTYRAHRIIWFLMTKRWPIEVDHRK